MAYDHHLRLPSGFRFAGCYCGIKKNTAAKDLTLIVADQPAVAAGVYTQNHVVAAPVLNCRAKTPTATARAVVVNSGNANACTGARGAEDAQRMCATVAAQLGDDCRPEDVLVMSTGVIGHFLPMHKVEAGIATAAGQLSATAECFEQAADGILTTDIARKVGYRTLELNGETISIVGMAKGAGMIGPNMATMLGCLMTDAQLDPARAQQMLARVANRSFNNISVEGHTSTNDSLLLLASGASSGPLDEEGLSAFETALTELAIELAKQIPTDGEGAKHLIEVCVRGAASDREARQISLAVASSNLVKTAVAGNDPNWGRIVSAAGYAGPTLDLPHLALSLNGTPLFQAGEPVAFDAGEVSQSIRDNSVTHIDLVVGVGGGTCTHWTSDLTVEYVRFNSEYTT